MVSEGLDGVSVDSTRSSDSSLISNVVVFTIALAALVVSVEVSIVSIVSESLSLEPLVVGCSQMLNESTLPPCPNRLVLKLLAPECS